jgi:plastocyanin domain-containing protein
MSESRTKQGSVRRGADVQLAVMANDISYIKIQLDHMGNQLSSNYVNKEEFEPIKRLVYGTVAVVGTLLLGAIMGLVIMQGGGG